DLRPEGAERPEDERLGQVGRGVARRVRVEALAVVVEAPDLREAVSSEQPFQPPRRVTELGDAVLLSGSTALVAMLPVRLREQQSAAGFERSPGTREDEVGSGRVVEGVVKEARVEPMAEGEFLVVAGVEGYVEPLALGLLARDLDHLRRDVVALRVDTLSRC